MDVIEAIKSRKSVRAYKPIPVPRKILEEIIDISRRSPSTLNTQAWEITVVSGEALENIKKGILEKITAGTPDNPDVPWKPFEGKYRKRQIDLAIQIFQLMGIKREDKQKRAEWLQRGYLFFNAPAIFIISMDRSVDTAYCRIDVGLISQTICLAAMNYGLGTCIMDQGISFPDVVRKYTGIPDSVQMDICITIGYPDWDFPANKLESKREPLENFVTWCGF